MRVEWPWLMGFALNAKDYDLVDGFPDRLNDHELRK